MIKEIKLLEETRLESISLSEHKAMLPFYLFTCDGKLFYGICHMNGYLVKTPFFTVKSVNPDQHSAVLTMLVPYPNACHYCMRALIRTETYIHVNLSSFCGISMMPYPICNYFTVADLIRDSFCLYFKVSETDPTQIIWDSKEEYLKNTTTIIFHYRFGQDRHIKMNVYTKEKMLQLIIPKGIPRAITVPDLRKIEICTPIHLVEGKLDVLLNRKKQTKIRLH